MKGCINELPFGRFEHKPVTEYTLTNSNGMQVSAINYGATLTRLLTPDRNGKTANVVIGFDSLEGYTRNSNKYFGCIVGRYCNRIANAEFSLDGKEYHLTRNENDHCLHGGNKGFDKVWWNIEKNEKDCSLKLSYESKDGEEGFPGNLHMELVYRLTDDNTLVLEYFASADQATPVNFTNHSYFNLSEEQSILDHELTIFAEQYTEKDEKGIPTGRLLAVKNTAYDFCQPARVGKGIHGIPGGYDVNMVLDKRSAIAAALYDAGSGRKMDLFTTEPCVQFYSGSFLMENALTEKYSKASALCLEAQHFPDSPNHPSFPDTILRPGSIYRQTTAYKFSTVDKL